MSKGTGKSLSVICSSLHWLRNEEQKIIQEVESSEKQVKKAVSNDWLLSMQTEADNKEAIAQKSNSLAKFRSFQAKVVAVKSGSTVKSKGSNFSISSRNAVVSSIPEEAQKSKDKAADDEIEFVLMVIPLFRAF